MPFVFTAELHKCITVFLLGQEFISVDLNRGGTAGEDLIPKVSSCSYAHPPKLTDSGEKETEMPKTTRKKLTDSESRPGKKRGKRVLSVLNIHRVAKHLQTSWLCIKIKDASFPINCNFFIGIANCIH